MSQISRRPRPFGAVGVVLVLAVAAGAIQNLVLTFTGGGLAVAADDLLVLTAIALSALRWRLVPGLAFLAIATWIAWLAFALTIPHPFVPLDQVLLTFRQVTMPVGIALAAMTLTSREWKSVESVAIAIALANGVYAILEKVLGIRLIDPAPLALQQDVFLTSTGLPGYYMSYFASAEYVRAGGLFLNPAITGVACAVAAVLAFNREGRKYWIVSAILVVATLLTFSRAGMLILAIGLAYRQLSKVSGRPAALLALATGLLFGSGVVLTQGSEAHSDGLAKGVRDAFAEPLGRGFGYAGNLIAAYDRDGATESLIAIALSSGGLATLVLFVSALLYVCRPLPGHREEAFRLLALALLLSAAFAETAGAINATVPAWSVLGLVLAKVSLQDRVDGNERRLTWIRP